MSEQGEKRFRPRLGGSIRSRLSYKDEVRHLPESPAQPTNSLSRKMGQKKGDIAPSSRSSILSSSHSTKAPSIKSITVAKSVAAFIKTRKESANFISTSSDADPQKETLWRKPVKTVATEQITTELLDRDEQTQARFRQSLFATSIRRPSIDSASVVMQYPRFFKMPSTESMPQIGADAVVDTSSYQARVSTSEQHDDATEDIDIKDSSSEYKVSPFEQDIDTLKQAADFDDLDADVVFLSSKVDTKTDRQPVTRFRIHSINISVHSPVLTDMVQGASEAQVDFVLEEDAETLKLLFGLMYNTPAAMLKADDWPVVLRLMQCAEKYNVARGREMAVAYFAEQDRQGSVSPFVTYSFAVRYHLRELESAAAERSAGFDISCLPESVFSLMGFPSFQKLAAYHTRRQIYYSDFLNSIVIDPRDLAEQCYQNNGTCVILPWNNLKQKLAWKKPGRQEPCRRLHSTSNVMGELVTEIGQIDCGTCSRALVQAALQANRAEEGMPLYQV